MKVLPDEYKNLMFEYENAVTLQQEIMENEMYKKGFKDGIKQMKNRGPNKPLDHHFDHLKSL